VNDTFKEVCYPEVNHTVHHDAVTHHEFISEVNHTVHHDAVYETVIDVPGHMFIYDFTGYAKEVHHLGFFEHGFYIGEQAYKIYNGNGDPQEKGFTLRYLKSNCKYLCGYEYDCEYSLVLDNYWVPDTYKQILVTPAYDEIVVDEAAHYHTITDSEAYDEIVVDIAAHCDQEIDVAGHQGEFSDWCNDQPEAKDGRIIETRNVPDDMVNGHYSNWSDTPEGSCVKRSDFSIACENEPCQTREIPAVTHDETVCENIGGMADVTQNVKDVVASGHASFVFDNRPSPGGIFDIVRGTLLSQIADPAPGYVKTVTITFNMGCDSQDEIVTAGEYDVIDLAPRV
jgi:hypothetical protein